MPFDQNYTVARGEMFFGQFAPGTKVNNGERYIGNTPQFNITVEATKLDHFSSDRGIRTKDDSVTTQVNRTANLITDAIKKENLELFFFGTASIITAASATAQAETIPNVVQGRLYQLGASLARPSGARRLNTFTVTTPAAAVLGVDYKIDLDRGRLEVLEGSTVIAQGASLTVSYALLASSREHVRLGNIEKEGCLRFVSLNAKGLPYDYFFPWVKITPNGDFAMKGDEWQQIPLNIEVLELPGYAAGYIDGATFVP